MQAEPWIFESVLHPNLCEWHESIKIFRSMSSPERSLWSDKYQFSFHRSANAKSSATCSTQCFGLFKESKGKEAVGLHWGLFSIRFQFVAPLIGYFCKKGFSPMWPDTFGGSLADFCMKPNHSSGNYLFFGLPAPLQRNFYAFFSCKTGRRSRVFDPPSPLKRNFGKIPYSRWLTSPNIQIYNLTYIFNYTIKFRNKLICSQIKCLSIYNYQEGLKNCVKHYLKGSNLSKPGTEEGRGSKIAGKYVNYVIFEWARISIIYLTC